MKNNDFNILFTSSGRRVTLAELFRDALGILNNNGKIFTADLVNTSPTGFISNQHFTVPRVDSVFYIPKLLKICEDYNVTLIVPLIDTELEVLAKNNYLFEEIGVKVLVSSEEVNQICFDKHSTAKFFTDAGFDTPVEYNINEVLMKRDNPFPLLIKPAKGSSSIGVNIINTQEELAFYSKHLKDPLLQELLVGEEYTIDVLADFNGEPITAIPRLRMETRAGEVSKGMTVRNPILIEKAEEIVRKLPGAVGCITIQCFLTEDNDVKFIEINPRFGGGFPLSVQAGADYPRYIIEKMLGIKSELNIGCWVDGLVMLRYDEAVFVRKDQLID